MQAILQGNVEGVAAGSNWFPSQDVTQNGVDLKFVSKTGGVLATHCSSALQSSAGSTTLDQQLSGQKRAFR